MKNLFSIFIVAVLLTSCTGTDKFVLRNSLGKVNKVMVVTKVSDWNGDVGSAIRNSFGEMMVGLAPTRNQYFRSLRLRQMVLTL